MDDIIKNGLVLIVDDMPKNVQALGSILVKEKYEIAVATSGKKAISIIEKRRPDIILMDVMMPEMDGFEVTKKLKSNEDTRHIPVLFVSAKADTASKVKGFEIGGEDYITKPFSAVEVLARVKTHIKLKKAIDKINEQNKQLETRLEERTKELIKSERFAAFSLLSQGIVHNLKSPLTIISGNAQLLEVMKPELKNEIPENVKNYIDLATEKATTIHKTVNKMVEMVNSLMSKSRSDKSEKLDIINLNDIIEEELNFLKADLRFKHKTEKEINLSDKKLLTEVVPGEISQILQNLISNALDALHDNKEPRISISTGESSDYVWFSIKDNGPGISRENQDKIFDPFFTTKPKATSKKKDGPTGTGLGLHMCSQMVKSYNGEIKLVSEESKGTEFLVYLPKNDKAEKKKIFLN